MPGLVGDIVGAVIGSSAAGKAADVQAQSAQQALDFAKQVWTQTQANQAPFLQAGQGAVTTLAALNAPGGELAQPWTTPFTAPTLTPENVEQLDPGYQFRLEQGQQALERSAAARGGLTTGGTGKALERYGQEYASGEYEKVYNRALTEYQQAYNIFQQNQANRFNRLASLSGLGQTAAGTLGQQGVASAGQIGGYGQDVGAARASGYVGSANAWINALNQSGNQMSSLAGLFMGA